MRRVLVVLTFAVAGLGCQCVTITDEDCFSGEVCPALMLHDAGKGDAGAPGREDAGGADAGEGEDGGDRADAGPPDAGQVDAGTPDAGPADAGPPDAGPQDAGPPDAGPWLELRVRRPVWEGLFSGDCEPVDVFAHVPGQPVSAVEPRLLAFTWRDGTATAAAPKCPGSTPRVQVLYFGELQLTVTTDAGFRSASAAVQVLTGCDLTFGVNDGMCAALHLTTHLAALSNQAVDLQDSSGTPPRCYPYPWEVSANSSSADLWVYSLDSSSHVTGHNLQANGCYYQAPQGPSTN